MDTPFPNPAPDNPPGQDFGPSSGHDPRAALPDREVLITRVVDGLAGAADWEQFERLASTDTVLWRDLALAQRDQHCLEVAVGKATTIARAVSLPHVEQMGVRGEDGRSGGSVVHGAGRGEAGLEFGGREFGRGFEDHRSAPGHRRRISGWAGWAAAACLGLAYVGSFRADRPLDLGTNPQTGNLVPNSFGAPSAEELSSGDAMDLYLRKGAAEGLVVRELPAKLMDSAPALDGQGYEVLVIRQILERRVVPRLYEFSQDESGAPRPVPLRIEGPIRTLGPT